MLNIPVVWVRYYGPGKPCYSKVEGSQFFVIGEDGNVLSVMKGSLLFVPLFEAFGLDEVRVTEWILERMLTLAESCLLETGKVGTIYGVFWRSYQIGDEHLCVKDVGLACTLSEFNPTEGVLDEAECLKLGLPTVVELDPDRKLVGTTVSSSS